MKLKTIKFGMLLFTLLLVANCSDDYLDVDSRAEIDAADSGEVVEPEELVNGVYGMLTDWDYSFSYLGVTEIISDNADKGSSASDTGADKHLLDALEHTTTGPSVLAMWEHWYKSIGRASIAITYTTDYGLTDEAYKNRLIGEAKFLRALNYFWLVRSFGDVPLQHLDYVVRQPKADVYAFIEQDLLDAIELLPSKNEYASADLGRSTQGAAQGLLAKVYLYEEKWQDSYDMATAVVTGGNYDLHPNYAEVWRASQENGIESLFEVQGRGESIAHGVQQYSQVQGARGTGGWGWGFNIPSQNLLNAFNAEGDAIRRDATIIFAGETLWDGREVSASAENPMYSEKAYSSANAGDSDGDKNVRILRFSEVLLIQSEAALRIGADAATPLNRVRNRVNLGSVTSPTFADIWKERRLELAFEHDRWFDLVRTGEAQSAMAANGKTFEVGKHELFPIPSLQINQTPEMTQNPNW
ncbi:RagB/SusD family nutrient uptake outer membrane protein [Winogradskyella costae]|uniref:RagB/SusD family nutrient uptake outer membrane protein n=1 Tax=Winogradskyella costae TaxID=2697008 RepID=UPI0015C8CC4D|nr:RagB/SusD family nutrient uptake outer membrane protein [Winogradskyella costae]